MRNCGEPLCAGDLTALLAGLAVAGARTAPDRTEPNSCRRHITLPDPLRPLAAAPGCQEAFAIGKAAGAVLLTGRLFMLGFGPAP